MIDTATIQRHLLGRRRTGRFAVQHEIECDGVVRSLQGRVLDLSETGALVRLSEPEFRAEMDRDLFAVATRLAQDFPEGMILRFVRCRVLARASIVRVARQSGGGPAVLVCQFARPLSWGECRRLGIRVLPDGERA